MPQRTPKLNNDQITDLLRRAGLDPADWDMAGVAAKVNGWIADNHAELTDAEVKTWSTHVQAEHHDEFGTLAAVDFFEQCVIETGPDSAPWQGVRARVDAGEFDGWDPVWVASKPAPRQPNPSFRG
jgi:hypothetical protein